jgi:hypothetical protein
MLKFQTFKNKYITAEDTAAENPQLFIIHIHSGRVGCYIFTW